MIEIFEGRLGGGKTYSAVARALVHLSRGGHVYTNVDLNLEGCRAYCAKYYKVEIEDSQVTFFAIEEIETVHLRLRSGTRDCPVLVILDEAQLWFNSRDWNKTNRDFLTFLTQSRKVSVDFIFISQSMLNIDKQFMRLVQYIWKFKDMQRLKLPVFGIMWPFPQIFAGQYDYDGKTLLFGEWIWKNKDVFAAYNTNALLKPIQFAGGTIEKRELKRAERQKKRLPISIQKVDVKQFKAIVYFAGVMLLWLVTLLKLKYNL